MTVQYLATVADLNLYGIKGAALATFTDAEKLRFIAAASLEFTSAASAQKKPPYQDPIPDHVVMEVCKVAAYEMLRARGYDPETGDKNVKVGADEARANWKAYAAGRPIAGLIDASTDFDEEGPDLSSGEQRGV